MSRPHRLAEVAGDVDELVATDEDVVAYTDRLLTETREEITRADQKASTLLTAVGVAVTLLIGLLTGHWSPTRLHAGIAWLWWLGAVALVVAIVALGSAVMPRIGHKGDPSTVTFFGHVNQLTDRARLKEHLRRSAADPLERGLDQLVVLSRIAQRKYRCTQVAMWCLAATAVTMTAAVVINVKLH